MLLNDVFDYTLDEIAELVSSCCGRRQDRAQRPDQNLLPEPVGSRREESGVVMALRLYVDRFDNRR